MSSENYLPPLVTKLKGDISDLKGAFAQSILDAKAWAAEMKQTITGEMKVVAHTTTETFRTETTRGFRDLGDDVVHDIGPSFAKAGAQSGAQFGQGFSGVASSSGPYGIAAIIAAGAAAAVFLMPTIGAAIGAALTLGVGLGWIGLGAFILKDDKKIISEAHKLGNDVKQVFTDAVQPMKQPVLDAIGLFRRGIKDLGPEFKAAFAAVSPSIKPLTSGLIGGVEAFMPGFTKALENSAPLIGKFADNLPEFLGRLGDFFQKISENGPALERFLDDAFTASDKLLTGLGDTIAWLEGAYLGMAEFADGMKADMDSAGDSVSGWYDDVVKWGGKAVDWIKGIPDKVKAGLNRLPGDLKKAAHQAFLDFSYWIGWGVGRAVKFVKDFPQKAEEHLKKFASLAIKWGKDAVDGLVKRVADLIPQGKKKLKEFADQTVAQLKGAPKWLYQAGKDALTGLVHGVADSIDWAKKRVKEAMHNIVQGAKDGLGIHSPSTVFAELGRYSVEGYAQGVNQNAATAWAAWAGVLAPAGAGRPNLGGPALSPDIVQAGRAGGAAIGQDGHTVVNLILDGNVIATALVPHASRTNARNNRPVLAGATR